MASKDEQPQEQDMGLEAAENGNDPEVTSFSSVEVEETQKIFELHLPEELWEIILNQLTNDEDRRNCCTALPLFDQLLTKSKPLWMFKQILPFVDPFLGENDKLSCRRVCTQWNADMDQFITPGRNERYSFNSIAQINSFIQTFVGHSSNPFIDRAVCIKPSSDRNAREYLRKLFHLLNIFGEYIWTLDFSWNPPLRTNSEDALVYTYWCLHKVLMKTPNLRHLTYFESSLDYSGALTGTYFRTLSPVFLTNPLPAIPSLVVLKAGSLSTSGFPQSLTNALISPYILHLQTIQTEWISCQLALAHGFPKLAHLDLRGVPNNKGLGRLLRICLNASLKKLEIEFQPQVRFIVDSSPISIPILIRVLHQFPVLEEFAAWNIAEIETGVDVSNLTNSTVRDLTLQFMTDSPHFRRDHSGSFNFLQVFKALEELSVHIYSPMDMLLGRNEGEGALQFYKMLEEGQLYESNIWRLIPSLKTVRISGDRHFVTVSGNRREFEKYQARQQAN